MLWVLSFYQADTELQSFRKQTDTASYLSSFGYFCSAQSNVTQTKDISVPFGPMWNDYYLHHQRAALRERLMQSRLIDELGWFESHQVSILHPTKLDMRWTKRATQLILRVNSIYFIMTTENQNSNILENMNTAS